MLKAVTLAVTVVFFFAGVLQAQSPNATVTGRVTDPSKSIIADAKVTLINTGTNVHYEGATNEAGNFYVTNLPVGTYRMEVEKIGFKTVIKPDIILHVQDAVELNFEMALGSTAETVTVPAEATEIQLVSSAITGEVNATTVRELPLNGRDWTQLATLQPGVASLASEQLSTSGSSSGGRGNRGFGSEVTISGARPTQNNYRLDGISINDYANSSPGDVLGGALGVDAIEEFSVLTSNYSAEYGRTSGGVVNAITRTGTNQYHGSAYEFLRNSALDAKNFFDQTIPPFKRNQFGASMGGPIWKDRTFFFADYEGLRQSLGITGRDTVPSLDARNGILHNKDGTTTNVVVDPLIKPILSLWGSPNGGLLGTGNSGVFQFGAQDVTSENFVTGRIDHKLSEADSLFGSFQWDRALSSLPDGLDDVLVAQKTARVFAALGESHAFNPQLINSIHGGFNRSFAQGGFGLSAINPVTADLSLGATPGRDVPKIFVAGLTHFNGGVNDGDWTRFYWNSFQGYDDAFLNRGNHSLKFGIALERDQENVFQQASVGGTFQFGSLAGFLTNQPTTLSATLPSTVTPRYLRQTIFGAYVQDDIRWRPNFTVNLGLRYEMSTVPTEAQNKLSNMRNPTDTAPHLGNPFFFNPTLRNFEPHVGFAWDPFKDGKTSVRAGFGMFDVLPLTYEYALTVDGLAPFTLTGRAAPLAQGSFPKIAFASLAVLNKLRVAYIEPHPHRDYVMQWNFNVQRQIRPDLSAMIAYVGSRGVHQLFRGDDMNMVMPTLTPAGYLWPSPAGSGASLNPNVGRIDVTTWSTNSFYDALELQIVKRMSHGFQIQGSYTWGKSIDEGSGSALGDPYNNSISNLFWFDPKLNRALTDFNVGQNLVINYTWNVPTPKSLQGAAGWALGGWQLGTIFQARTGLPFTPLVGGDPLGTNDTSPYAFPNRLTGPGCQSLVNPGNVDEYFKLQCFTFPNPSTLLGNAGRNILIGPGLVNFDFSLFKNNYIKRISESFNVQFRAEFFNIFNRPNFNPPDDNNTIFDQGGAPISGAGLIDSTSTTAREIQFALKLIW